MKDLIIVTVTAAVMSIMAVATYQMASDAFFTQNDKVQDLKQKNNKGIEQLKEINKNLDK